MHGAEDPEADTEGRGTATAYLNSIRKRQHTRHTVSEGGVTVTGHDTMRSRVEVS